MAIKRHFTAKQWLTIILMELITLGITGIFVWQFVAGVKGAEEAKTSISPMSWVCLGLAIALFIGLNILMIFLIKKQRARAQ